MVEIFTTNIPNLEQANSIITTLESSFPGLKINFDIERTIINYPCDHSIFRVEGNIIEAEGFMSLINKLGFKCDILEDKICNY